MEVNLIAGSLILCAFAVELKRVSNVIKTEYQFQKIKHQLKNPLHVLESKQVHNKDFNKAVDEIKNLANQILKYHRAEIHN